jgi:hypothetical protein
MKTRLLLMLAFGLAASAHADTLYLCKAYSGGTFWAQRPCSQHHALIERMLTMPSGLPFDQQVALGQQSLNQTAQVTQAAQPTMTVQNTAASNLATCKALDTQISSLDALARQPQSGATQDWITQRRREARDQQFRLRCQ